MRRRLPNNLLVQIIAGPRRDGIFGLILWLIAAIVLGAAPVSLLVFFQLQFLPYHDAAMTWWQRGIVLADLVLLWRYWPRIGLPELEAGKNGWPLHRGFVETTQQLGTLAGMLLLSVGVGALALLIATFRGERLEAEFGSVSRIASLRRLVVAGELDANTHKPTSPWSDRLVLPNLDLTGRERPETGGTAPRPAQVVSLRGRRLEGVVLFGARLGSIDLTAAHLEGAMLGSADLRGAVLDEARLQGATLDGARLQGLRLVGVHLQGASLTDAHLEGAVLRGTRLEGAVLNAAHLQGALLEDVQLQGASLDRVELQSALLERPQLQGASLVQAHLEGALIDGAQLQGATLDRVQLAGTLLRNAFAWRAYIRPAEPAAVRTEGVEAGAKQRDAAGRITDWSAASWTDLKQRVASEAPRNAAVMTALWRLDRLDPEISLKDDQEAADQWARLQSQAPSLAVYEAASVATWRRIGCAEEGAPQVMANMVEALFSPQPLFPRDSVQPAALAAAFLQEGCVGANGLSDEQRARLKSLQERVVLKPAAAIVKPPAPAAKPN